MPNIVTDTSYSAFECSSPTSLVGIVSASRFECTSIEHALSAIAKPNLLTSGVQFWVSSTQGLSGAVREFVHSNLSKSYQDAITNNKPEFTWDQRERDLVSTYREMFSYRYLTKGWDGPNSVSPSQRISSDAIRFLSALPRDVLVPEATVYSDGTVGWYWRSKKSYITVHFTKPDMFSYFARLGSEETLGKQAEYKSAVPKDLLQAIRKFI
jgi:hypothetical protein